MMNSLEKFKKLISCSTKGETPMKPFARDHHAARLSVGFHAKQASLSLHHQHQGTQLPTCQPTAPGPHGGSPCMAASVTQACESRTWGARREKLHVPLSAWVRKVVHTLAGQGLSHGSIFISDFDNCLYVLKTKMTSF